LAGVVAESAVATPIQDKYHELGGSKGALGDPTTGELPGVGGDYQLYRHGSIFYSPVDGFEVQSRCPGWACSPHNSPAHECSSLPVLRTSENEALGLIERQLGEVTTWFKRVGIIAKGWRSTGCFFHNASGRVVRSPQYSTDGAWTVDLQLDSFVFEGKPVHPDHPVYIRLEIWPRGVEDGTGYAHHQMDINAPAAHCPGASRVADGSYLPRGTRIDFGGLVVVDVDHDFAEIHPDKELRVHEDLGPPVAAGTSPAIAKLPVVSPHACTFRLAFQAKTGDLTRTGPAGPVNEHLGMRAGTSPAITWLTNGGYEAAVQANTGELWRSGTAGTADEHRGMMAGTSPAIASFLGPTNHPGWEIAFQANTGELWRTGTVPGGAVNEHLGMRAGTSPAITGMSGTNHYQIAFQANNGELWRTGAGRTVNEHQAMMAGTSPAIAGLTNGGYEIAFQNSSGELVRWGTAGNVNEHQAMMAGTSPAITWDRGRDGGNYEIAFQTNTGELMVLGPTGRVNTHRAMMRGTSPSIAALPDGGYEVTFLDSTGSLSTFRSDG
jgi:hypothetical protein